VKILRFAAVLARPTLFLIMDRVGLKMEPAKGAVDVWVIERVERPSENRGPPAP